MPSLATGWREQGAMFSAVVRGSGGLVVVFLKRKLV
jgi:hypothetical protein